MAQPLIVAGQALLTAYLSPEERRQLSLRDGIERALAMADEEQRAALLRLQGMLALLPALGDLTVENALNF
jgi:hypothetical protein